MASPARKGPGHKRAADVNHNVGSSNSTVNVFLGGKQKAWMHQNVDEQSHPVQPLTQRPTAQFASNATQAWPPPQGRVNQTKEQITSNTGEPVIQRARPPHQVPATSVTTGASSKKTAVLPSPTPSNEETAQPSRRVDSFNESRPHVGQVQQPTASGAGSPISPRYGPATIINETAAEIDRPNATDGYALDSCLSRLQTQLKMIRETTHPQKELEQARVQLLIDACKRKDYFYLTLHQVFCSFTICPDTLPIDALASLRIPSAFSALDQVLVPNFKLAPMVISWCALFPFPLSEVKQRWPAMYEREFVKLKVCFNALSERWVTFVNHCKQRQCPPMARELVVTFNISSILLQKVIFTSILRGFWGPKPTEWSIKAETLFATNQLEYNIRFSLGGPPTALQVIEECHAKSWKEWFQLHMQHLGAQTAQLPQNQGPANNTARQPQQNPRQVVTNNTTIVTGSAQPRVVPSQRSVTTPTTPQFQPPANLQRRPSNPQNHVRHGSDPSHRRLSNPASLPQSMTGVVSSSPHPQTPHSAHPGSAGPALRPQVQAANASVPQPQVQQVPKPRRLLIPRAGFITSQPANPLPTRHGLHQAHLRSPVLKVRSPNVSVDHPERFYHYMRRFALEPARLSSNSAVSRFAFTIDPSRCRVIPKDEEPSQTGGRRLRQLEPVSEMYRLRCSKLDVGSESLDEQNWVVADNHWPSSFYFQVNSNVLEVRRKLHHGRDLPVDITQLIKEGENTVHVYMNLGANADRKAEYAVAVEVIGLTSHENIKSRCTESQKLSAAEALDVIKASLSSPAKDDDVAIVSSTITVNLMDPISSTKMPEIPVRGRHCLHPQCFDLETFLLSRTTREPGSPTLVDEWRCPICKMDVRPQSLVFDGFIAEVTQQLASVGQSSTKAIVIEQDGSWKPRVDLNSGKGRLSSADEARPTLNRSRSSEFRETIIIDLE